MFLLFCIAALGGVTGLGLAAPGAGVAGAKLSTCGCGGVSGDMATQEEEETVAH